MPFDAVVYIAGHGETKDETARCLCQLAASSRHRFDIRFSHSDALIGRSRSICCTRFLQAGDAPFMLFIDSDMSFTIGDAERILEAMQAGYNIVAGGYAMADAKHFAIRGLEPTINIDGKPQEVQYASTGFMGISRKALIDIVEKLELPLLHKGIWCELWPFFESGSLPEEGIYISEDWFFCNLARKAGYKVYFHTGVLVGHIKTAILPAQGAINLPTSPSQNGPLSVECLVKSLLLYDLAEFLKLPADKFAEEFKENPEEKMAQEFRAWTGSAEDFYKQPQRSYLFELARFNAADGYWQGKVGALGDLRGVSIVDIGCGIGTVALFLAMNRNRVTGYDISPTLLEFANFRNDKFGFANATFTDDFPEDALSRADYVIAIDVFEHIEDLKSFLGRLGSCMKSEAKLYHVDSFLDKRPMHFDHSDSFHHFLAEARLTKIDPQWVIKGI